MALDANDRALLYRTSVVSHQVQKYLLHCKDGRSTIAELKKFFYDLSSGLILSTLYSLRKRGVLEIVGDVVTVKPENVLIRGAQSDMVWRAIRLHTVFTIRDIAYLTQYSTSTVSYIIKDLVKTGAVKRVGKSKKVVDEITNTIRQVTIYEATTTIPLRPIADNSGKTKTQADAIWIITKKLQEPWTITDILKRYPEAKRDYVKDLLKQWNGLGMIEKVEGLKGKNNATLYKCTSRKNRPAVIKKFKEEI